MQLKLKKCKLHLSKQCPGILWTRNPFENSDFCALFCALFSFYLAKLSHLNGDCVALAIKKCTKNKNAAPLGIFTTFHRNWKKNKTHSWNGMDLRFLQCSGYLLDRKITFEQLIARKYSAKHFPLFSIQHEHMTHFRHSYTVIVEFCVNLQNNLSALLNSITFISMFDVRCSMFQYLRFGENSTKSFSNAWNHKIISNRSNEIHRKKMFLILFKSKCYLPRDGWKWFLITFQYQDSLLPITSDEIKWLC